MDSTLTIGRLRTACHVAGSRFAPAVRDRASHACRDHLPLALRSATHALGGNDDSVWIVRRIDLSIIARLDADAGALALSISRSLGRALAKVLIDDGDGTNAIRFRSRGAYLSRFFTDVAAGTAWTRWYFAPLSGWRLLPASAAIRAAVLDDPVAALEALRGLDDRELQGVAESLSLADESLILTALAGMSADAEVLDVPVNVATAQRLQPATFALATRPLVRHLRSRSSAAIAAAAPPSIVEAACTRFGGLILLLRDLNALPWDAYTAGWPRPSEDVRPETCLKWLTLALCSGHCRAGAFLADDLWKDLLGIPRTLSLREVGTWLRSLGSGRRKTLARAISGEAVDIARSGGRWFALPQATGVSPQWARVLALLSRSVFGAFARRLPGFANSSVDFLWRNFLDIDAVVEREQDRVVVRCGRAPLHVVLALTGMTRGLVTGTDGTGSPIVVFSRE